MKAALPLDIDCNSIDTSMPLIEDGVYDLMFKKVEKKQTTSGEDMLSLDIVTTGPTKSRDQKDLGPGVHVFDNCMFEPLGGSDWDMVTKNIASITQSAGLDTTRNAFINGRYIELQGRTFKARIGYAAAGISKKTGKEYKEKNTVSLYIPADGFGVKQ
jgi:hypothetical protein